MPTISTKQKMIQVEVYPQASATLNDRRTNFLGLVNIIYEDVYFV